eukprot:Polyplicarium_translucidae@DN3109_c0_g2_i11.p1
MSSPRSCRIYSTRVTPHCRRASIDCAKRRTPRALADDERVEGSYTTALDGGPAEKLTLLDREVAALAEDRRHLREKFTAMVEQLDASFTVQCREESEARQRNQVNLLEVLESACANVEAKVTLPQREGDGSSLEGRLGRLSMRLEEEAQHCDAE